MSYSTQSDMEAELQNELLVTLEAELASRPLSVLFLAETLTVPSSVPEFWLGVTKRLAPRLRAMAIVSTSLAVRSSATAFSIANRLRGVKVSVKSFTPPELEAARAWCATQRKA